MKKSIEKLYVEQQEIRLVDKLLMVVGNHGVGKTRFLNAIVNGKYKIHGDFEYEMCSLLLTNTSYNSTLTKFLDCVNDFKSYVNDTFEIVNKEEILKKIRCKEDLFLNVHHYYLAYRRLIILQTLLQIEKPQIIVIDEPELYAHPILIRDICMTINKLQQKGHLVILATNSETVVSKLFVDIEQIIRLEENNTIIQADAEVLIQSIKDFYNQDVYLLRRFSASNQLDEGLNNILNNYIRIYLSSVFTKQIFNIMHADCVILGEGSSEDVFFDYIDQIISPKWMRENRVHFMGCLGKSTMPFYFIFLNHLRIRVVSLFDADKDSNLVHDAYAKAFKKYENEQRKLFARLVLNPDLEHVLQIVPNYKLQSLEKPINIYYHTFVTNNVCAKVNEIADLIYMLFKNMKG